MDLLLQSVFLDPGPSLPEPGRADVLGTTRDMRVRNAQKSTPQCIILLS